MIQRTLVVAPHPDDEVLGCGGTLLRRKAEGGKIGWLIVTGISEAAGWPAERVRLRDEEIGKVGTAFGFDEVFNLRLPTTHLDEIPTSDLVSAISSVFKAFEPDEVLVPHRGDIHSDHRATFDAVAACSKWFRYPSVRRVMAYETVSETEFGMESGSGFRANVYVEIGAYLEKKLEIMQIYRSEIAEFPFPRSVRTVRALAEWRGSNAGWPAAEAFELLRERQ